METRFEFKDFLKVFGLAIFLFIFFVGLLKLTPGAGTFLSTLHPSISFLIEYLLQFVILFCPLWIFVVGKYNASLEDLGFKKVRLLQLIKTVLTCYVGYLIFAYLLTLVLSKTGLSLPGYENQESYIPLFGDDLRGYIVGFILVGGIAPFAEEILFRGFIYRVFIKNWPIWLGSILSAALFALIHIQFQTFIPLFVLGLLLNYSYRKTGSIWTPIALHSLNNILAFSVEVYFSLHPEALAHLAQMYRFLYTA